MSARASAIMRWTLPLTVAVGTTAMALLLALALVLTLRDREGPRRMVCYDGQAVIYQAVVKWDWRGDMVDATTGAGVALPYGACVFDSVEGK